MGNNKLFWLLQPVIASCALVGCNPHMQSRHRTIIYDEAWSRTAAVKNLPCVAELRKSCEREANEEEANLSRSLPAIFQSESECRNVQFITSVAGATDEPALQQRLERNVGGEYWRLRVDFHPRLTGQPWNLGSGAGKSYIEGGGVEYDTAYICKAVKNNGVMDIW